MTAQLAPGTGREPAVEDVYGLIWELTRVLHERTTPSGHPYAVVQSESRGTCPPRYCSERCQHYRALYLQATRWLERHAPARQLGLLDGEG